MILMVVNGVFASEFDVARPCKAQPKVSAHRVQTGNSEPLQPRFGGSLHPPATLSESLLVLVLVALRSEFGVL